MIDLKKLLVCDGRPSKEMIDYIVNSNIESMVADFAHKMSKTSYSLTGNTVVEGYLNIEKNHELYTHFSIASYPQHYSEVTKNVFESVKRYESFVEIKEFPKDPFDLPHVRPNIPTLTEFTLTIKFTPEMKKMILLEQELPSKESEQNRKPKI